MFVGAAREMHEKVEQSEGSQVASDALGSVDPVTYARVWNVIGEIGVQERHFNELQSGYRNMASGWLLAVFAGIGFSLSQKLQINIPCELLIAAIAAAGCVGIGLLWILDLLVYHRLLDACFIEGLFLEERYPWLPPLRHNMMETQAGQGVLFRTIGFYLIPINFLILVASFAFAWWLKHEGWQFIAAPTVVAGFTLAYFATKMIRNATENTAAIERVVAHGKQYCGRT